MKLSKEIVIQAGGKLWEKANKSRVYLNQEAFDSLFASHFSDYSKYANYKIGNTKIWFDCVTETLHSDKGSTRVMFNGTGITCSK